MSFALADTRHDPFLSLPIETVGRILAKLDACALARCGRIKRGLRDLVEAKAEKRLRRRSRVRQFLWRASWVERLYRSYPCPDSMQIVRATDAVLVLFTAQKPDYEHWDLARWVSTELERTCGEHGLIQTALGGNAWFPVTSVLHDEAKVHAHVRKTGDGNTCGWLALTMRSGDAWDLATQDGKQIGLQPLADLINDTWGLMDCDTFSDPPMLLPVGVWEAHGIGSRPPMVSDEPFLIVCTFVPGAFNLPKRSDDTDVYDDASKDPKTVFHLGNAAGELLAAATISYFNDENEIDDFLGGPVIERLVVYSRAQHEDGLHAFAELAGLGLEDTNPILITRHLLYNTIEQFMTERNESACESGFKLQAIHTAINGHSQFYRERGWRRNFDYDWTKRWGAMYEEDSRSSGDDSEEDNEEKNACAAARRAHCNGSRADILPDPPEGTSTNTIPPWHLGHGRHERQLGDLSGQGLE